MGLIDEQFLETPWYGSRQMARHLRRNGAGSVGRHRVRRLMTTEKRAQVAGQPELVHAVAVRANMRSILVAMMKSFSCSPLIFLVCRETVALPQPKLIVG